MSTVQNPGLRHQGVPRTVLRVTGQGVPGVGRTVADGNPLA